MNWRLNHSFSCYNTKMSEYLKTTIYQQRARVSIKTLDNGPIQHVISYAEHEFVDIEADNITTRAICDCLQGVDECNLIPGKCTCKSCRPRPIECRLEDTEL